MCYGCYIEYGKPRICTDATRLAADLIGKANPWGPLHVVVEDDNLEDEFLGEDCRHRVYSEGSPADIACFEALVKLTMDERVSAMAICSGYIDPITGADNPEWLDEVVFSDGT